MKVTFEMTVEEFERLFGEKEIEDTPVKEPSRHAVIIDKTSPFWRDDEFLFMCIIDHIQREANSLLKTKGELYLNNVYDMLGLPKRKIGQIVGWSCKPCKKNYVQISITPIEYEKYCLDFNCGYIGRG